MLDSDEALAHRVTGGDMDAFDALYARYESRLFGFLLSQVKNRADAEDLFHEAFMAALRRPPADLSRAGAFRTWLYRVARNCALNRMRSDRRGARAMASLPSVAHAVAGSADQALEERELEGALDRAVSLLPPPLAEVFHLRSSGLSYEEMADVLEIPLGTLKSRMNQMVTHLREELRPWTAG